MTMENFRMTKGTSENNRFHFVNCFRQSISCPASNAARALQTNGALQSRIYAATQKESRCSAIRTHMIAIGERAGMGASSIYRHVRSKHELLVLELSDLQEEAWLRFRHCDDKSAPTRERVQRFLDVQHDLLASDADLVVIALRATTYPEAPVARRALALQDRAVGLLTEILQSGRRDLAPGVDALAAGRALFHVASGARISWANGLLSESACRRAIDESVDLLFRGLSAGGSGADPA